MPWVESSSLKNVITALWWRLTGLGPRQPAETRIEGSEMTVDETLSAVLESLKPNLLTHGLFFLTDYSRSGRC